MLLQTKEALEPTEASNTEEEQQYFTLRTQAIREEGLVIKCKNKMH